MKVSIDLPDQLVKKAEEKSKEMGFSLSEFIEYLLVEYISTESNEDMATMKEKLKSLGYME